MSRRLVLDDGRAERELVVRERIVVGRDPSCDVSDSDPRLSRRHAEFLVTPKGLVVKDLDSRNGVRVNGRPVQETLLTPGDLVEIAHLSVRFVDDAPVDPADQALRTVNPRPVEGVQVKEGFEDDRTRVLPSSAGLSSPTLSAQLQSTTLSGPVTAVMGPMRPVPADAGEATIRTGQRGSGPAAPPVVAPIRFGIRDLLASRWGLRVLGQGMLLACVVFLITIVPMLNWFTSVTGPVPGGVLARMLVAPLLAAIVAGLMVASLIARTTAKGLGRDDQSEA
jgi:pSer/pThr/pTyr-binding forkhead associated (FHA) protein